MAKQVDARALKSWLHQSGEIALLDVRELGQFGEGHLLTSWIGPNMPPSAFRPVTEQQA